MNRSLSFNLLLLFFFGFITVLIGIRIIYTGKMNYLFLVWNLFLAWLPFIISTGFKKMESASSNLKKIMLFLAWLIFFPNALYIITDLVHLEQKTNIAKWFDAILIFSASILGLMMAFISLLRVESFLVKHFSRNTVNRIIAGIIFLGSFGVYIGRFLRWNSWDIISNPSGLAAEIGERFIFPLQHLRTWSITCILTILFYLLYVVVKKMPGYLNQASVN